MSALHHLSEADLEALSSRLTLRRARKDVEAALTPTATAHPLEGGVVVTWDDATCTLPEGGLTASRCTCPARRLCRHRVRTVLYLQQRAEAQSTAPPDWSPAAWTPLELEKAAGRTAWKQALAALAEGVAVEKESQTSATFPALGVRVRFLPGLPLREAICSCGAQRVCAHRVLAALSWQPQAPRTVDLDPEAAAVQERVWGRLVALLSAGLDGAPPEAIEGLRALSQRTAQHLPAPARDLNALADVMAAYHARSARDSSGQWLWTTGRLGARLLALADTSRQAPAVALRGRGRRAHLAASRMTVLGLGAEGFLGNRGVVVKCWFLSPETGEWLHASVGRSHTPGDDPLPPRALWRAPLWDGCSPSDAAHGPVQLTGARLSPDGALSTSNVAARPQPDPVRPGDLPPGTIAEDTRALAARWSQQAPPILRGSRDRWLPAVIALAKNRPFLDAPTFAEAGQVLTLPVALLGGGTVTLRLPYGPDTAQAIAALERVRDWPAPPTHMMVRCWPTDGGIAAAPVSVWLAGQPRPTSLGLGAPIVGAHKKPWRTVVTDAPPTPGDAVLDRLRVLLDTLESLAVEGLSRGGRWRAEQLTAASVGLAALGLDTGAAQASQLAAALRALSMRPEATGDEAVVQLVRLLSWATALEEAWLLQRCAVSPAR